MPSSSSSRGRHRRRRRGREKAPSLAAATPAASDWAALPRDILLDVMLRLRADEIMKGPELACAAWRRVAVDEPTLWRRLDMSGIPLSSPGLHAAVDRSAGQCDAFTGSCDDESLLYLVERAPSLKTIQLGLKKLPLLVDLKVQLSDGSTPTENLLGSVCQSCPRLKELSLKFYVTYDYEYSHHEEMLLLETIEDEIPMMTELCSLELFDCVITTEGLTTILDNCPLLESLHVIGCFDADNEMGWELRSKCARVKNLILPDDSDGYYGSYFPDNDRFYDDDD